MKSNYRILLSFLILTQSALGLAGNPNYRVELRTEQHPAVTLATENDFSAATFEGRGNQQELQITLKSEAAQKLRSWTETHVGDPLDVVVDGAVLKSPTLRVPIRDGKFNVNPLDEHEVRVLRDALKF